MKIAKHVGSWFIALLIIASIAVGIWYFFGSITVTATYEGERLPWTSVTLDGKQVCKNVPCTFRPLPGFHRIVVVPPEETETREKDIRWAAFTMGRGETLEAEFHEPDPPEQYLVLKNDTANTSFAFRNVEDCIAPAKRVINKTESLCVLPPNSEIRVLLSAGAPKAEQVPYPIDN